MLFICAYAFSSVWGGLNGGSGHGRPKGANNYHVHPSPFPNFMKKGQKSVHKIGACGGNGFIYHRTPTFKVMKLKQNWLKMLSPELLVMFVYLWMASCSSLEDQTFSTISPALSWFSPSPVCQCPLPTKFFNRPTILCVVYYYYCNFQSQEVHKLTQMQHPHEQATYISIMSS